MIVNPISQEYHTTYSWPDNLQVRPSSPKTSRFWAYAEKVHTLDTRARVWDIDEHHGQGDELLHDDQLRKRLADMVGGTRGKEDEGAHELIGI